MRDTASASPFPVQRDLVLWRFSGLASVMADLTGCSLGEETEVESSNEMVVVGGLTPNSTRRGVLGGGSRACRFLQDLRCTERPQQLAKERPQYRHVVSSEP